MSTETLLESRARPELDALLLCARSRLDARRAGRLEAALASNVKWDALLDMARRHGLLPLLAWHVQAVCPGRVPPEVLARLRSRFESNFRRNLFLAGELHRVLHVLQGEEIAAVPLKGVALAVLVYRNLGSREFSDLDFLIQAEDALKAREALLPLGYQPRFELDGKGAARYLETQTELGFERQGGQVHLELHWEVAPRYFAFDLGREALERRRVESDGEGSPLPVLTPEDTLLVLAAHAAKHHFERLIWISDVAELIGAYPAIDWEQAFDQARRRGGLRLLLVSLLLARDLLEVELPPTVDALASADRAALRLAREVGGRLLSDECSGGELGARVLFHLRVRERLRDRARYAWRVALARPPRERAGPRTAAARTLRRAWRGAQIALRALRPAGKDSHGTPGR